MTATPPRTFAHVDYLWDDTKAAALDGDEVALFLYRSNILGADLRITNYGGGNTSCKTTEKHPLTGEDAEVLWVKGSGGDIGTLTRQGIAGLYVQQLHEMKNVYRGLEHEDEMVALAYHALYDLESRAPSIDTPLHGLLPYKHIDHLHPDALIAVAAAEGSERITKEIWGDTMGWVPWQRPGFDLGLQLERCVKENPGIRGIVLGSHGLFTWGDTSYECYINSLEVIERASEYIAERQQARGSVFGGAKRGSEPAAKRMQQAAKLAPVLRGLCSSDKLQVGHFTDDARVLEFVNSHDLDRLAPMGTSCPDHFLRTKIQPLVLSLPSDADLSDYATVRGQLEPQVAIYRQGYKAYYETHATPDSPAIRDPNPVIILWPGIGMFAFAKNKQTARVASEFYINAINVMRGAEAISSYTALPRSEAFAIEYWQLEEDKLKRQPPEKPLSRRVAFVTGAGGGIGKAIADKLAAEGACVIISDVAADRAEANAKTYKRDTAVHAAADVTDAAAVGAAIDAGCLAFGGIDIVVNCAGLAISKPIADTQERDWDLLQDVLVKGQFLVSQRGAEVMRKQGTGGDIVNIASKNGLVSGPNNVGYGTAKAAQLHMSRLLAAELGHDKIRVNVVNPDAVIGGSKIWEGAWAEGRAKAYGITVEELPAHYAKRTLLNEIIEAEDIADGVFSFVAIARKSTGNILNVDGGVAAAFVR